MRKNLSIIFLSLTFLLPTVSHAARDSGTNRAEEFVGKVYLGLKYGRLTIAEDVPDTDGTDIRDLGLVFGRGINDNFAVEFAYDFTTTKDDTSTGDISADALGLYLVAKTTGDVYVKGRLGYTRLTLERNFAGDSFDTNAYGMSYGIGVGVRLGPGVIEAEYTFMPKIDNTAFVGAPVEVESDYLSVAYVWGYD